MAVAAKTPHLFEDALWAWFWEQFEELGGCGIFVNDSRLEEKEYTLVEEHLAKMVFDSFPCAPFTVRLYNKLQEYDDQVALLISVPEHQLRVGSVKDSSLMYVEYSWPEVYSEIDERGDASGGTHRHKRETFDLAAPGSVDLLRECVWRHCVLLVSNARPHSDLGPDSLYPLFHDNQCEPQVSETGL